MAGQSAGRTRNTTTRDRHRSVIARGKPDCALCRLPIDYTIKYPDAKSYVVDHIDPWVSSNNDELSNKQPAHADCNWAKAAKVEAQLADAPRVFVTTRTW